MNRSFLLLSAALLICLSLPAWAENSQGLPETVSYYDHVRPVFQAKCQGCHQPAKAKSDYVMTEVEALIKGGETDAAILPGKPSESYLMELVVTQKGEQRPEMPPKDEPLTDYEVKLVEKWITQGAKDDTPENAKQRYTMENPPLYAVPPLVTSLDFSPDNKLIAVAGFHEVLVHRADGSGIAARLVGLSERIESVAFSPDGSQLLVAGGLPGRMGEIQIWDLAKKELKLSKIVGFDTAYGASWSPDGTLVAFGLPDNTVRGIKASNGDQVFFMGSHNDWVLDTTWSLEGDKLVSVGRDMSAKLTEVATERFIDNITSITPGALKGGINTVTRHPKQDHVLVGGSDGVPQIYRMIRETARKIGDNANLIRKYPAMEGRIWDASFAPDGKTFVAVSSLNGKGEISLYRSEYDATITSELKKLFETVRRSTNAAENKDDKIEEFQTRGAERLAQLKFDTALYSVAFSPDGKTIAAAGADGQIRLLNAADLKEKLAFAPMEIDSKLQVAKADATKTNHAKGKAHDAKEELPKSRQVVGIEVSPSSLSIDSPGAYRQLLVTAKLNTGETADLTRMVKWELDQPLAEVTSTGVFRPKRDGEAKLTVRYANLSQEIPVAVSQQAADFHPDFVQDVNPIITRMGCNMGTCHGAKDGKGGFKLSLRGYDPLYDVRGFADDHSARRTNFASPDDSLMLLKATGAVPHEAGVVTENGSRYYHVVRRWIADGAPVNLESPKVASIELFPKNPVIQNVGAMQQIRVVARFTDGKTRDVTLESFIDSGNTEVAEHDDFGLLKTIRRGEAPILARYEGAYAATTLTVMGDREGFTWQTPETWGEIDKLVAQKWKRMKIQPSALSTDSEFIRRVYLDLTGLPPASNRVQSFLDDKRPTREKRDALVDELIGSPEFVDHWTNKWSDMLQVNSKFLGGEGAKLFRTWIHKEIESNRPYDEFVYEILTAKGSNKENPAASYYKILRDPDMIMENTTHLFLATRFNCNKCHDHPFERWTQDQYFETAAYFAQIDLKRDTKNAPKQNIGGTAVEGAKPLYEVVGDKAEGEIKHDRTGVVQQPAFPYEANLAKAAFTDPKAPTRREELAAWITSPDNQYFASSYANRIWGYLLGTGIIEPLDDIRAGNPPTNPQLLQHLTKQFIQSDFNVQELMAEICKSRTYQLSIEANTWNETDEVNFSKAKARRLPAETLYDAVYAVTGAVPDIPGAGKGVRASQLPDAKLDLKSGFLANLGRPARESACECERSDELQMSAVMAFLSGPAIADAIGSETNDLPGLVASQPDDKKLVEEIYIRVLARKPSAAEVSAALAILNEIEADHATLLTRTSRAEADWVTKRSELEIARLQKIAQAEASIAAYKPEYEKKKKEAETAQKQRIADADKSKNERMVEIPKLAQDFAVGIKADQLWTQWKPLEVATVTASDKTEVEILPDGSVRSKAPFKSRNLDYLVTGKTASKQITGIMIEAVPDESNAAYGAGLNPNGNFVITEIQTRWNPISDPKKSTPLAIAAAKADFNQNGFDVKNTFNGKVDRNDKGWALAGTNPQVPHRAVFQFKEPVSGDEKGAHLVVGVLCRYSQGDYPIGRFRIWYTTAKDPLQFGLPTAVAASVSKAPQVRTAEETKALETYVAENDAELRKRIAEHLKQQRPLPADQKMVALQTALQQAQAPVAIPSTLAQIRQDTEYSIQQAANRRLTAAQDLVWALVNSPSFLFNR
ncbi:MAG: DUF1549 domain-containing protein [Verrucomicrobiales bacterium]|nr:DUF1549 domain-containing protein [Verrucomicrobiales bacterium]